MHRYGIRRPPNLPRDEVVRLYGGGTLIFGENGILKYHIADRLLDQTRQSDVLQAMTDRGVMPSQAFSSLNRQTYASFHRLRQLNLPYSFLQEFR